MKSCLFTILLLLTCTNLISQHYFVKGYGDSLLNESISKIVKYDDTTFYICGYIDNPSSGKRGYIISKADSNFNLKWNKYYENFRFLNPKNFFLGSDSLLYSTGTYIDTNFLAKTALIKLDLNGDTLYSINLGDSIGDYYLKYVAENHDTLYFSGSRGSTNYEGVLVGINKLNGGIVRSHSFTRNIGTNIVIHEGVFDSLSNKFYFLCKIISDITNDYTVPSILTTNLDGSIISFHTLDDSAAFNYYFLNLVNNNSQIIVGYNIPNPNNSGYDFKYIILDTSLSMICSKIIRSPSISGTIEMFSAKNILLTNNIRLYKYNQIIDLDTNCIVISSKFLNSNINWFSQSLDSYLEIGNAIYSSGAFRYSLAPHNNYLIVKSDVSGNGCNSGSLNFSLTNGSTVIDSTTKINKNILDVQSYYTNLTLDTISLPEQTFCNSIVSVSESHRHEPILVTPNPFEDYLQIANLSKGKLRIQIYTIAGISVLDRIFNVLDNHIKLENLSYIPPALYILKITNENLITFTVKIVKS